MEFVEIQGEKVPALGFGTWQLTGQDCVEGVEHAIALGYRHIDTARIYRNEKEVGQGIANAGIDRDELFLTTKIWIDEFSRDKLPVATDDSLKSLRTDRVDLLLLHWPNPDVPLAETLDALRGVQEAGKARHVGVSNFPPSMVQEAAGQITVFCNQVEYHPYLSQQKLLGQAREMGHMLTAYSPIARGRVLDEPVLKEIGSAHGKSPAQVTLRWLIQQPQVAAIPKASTANHREANLDIFDFALTDDQMSRIDALGGEDRIIDPDIAPDWER
jgi:2,5-diketo-D-gluconate reductase B